MTTALSTSTASRPAHLHELLEFQAWKKRQDEEEKKPVAERMPQLTASR